MFALVVVTSPCPSRVSKAGWEKSFASRLEGASGEQFKELVWPQEGWRTQRSGGSVSQAGGCPWSSHTMAGGPGPKAESEHGRRSRQHCESALPGAQRASLGWELPGLFLPCGK